MSVEPCRRCGRVECAEERERELDLLESGVLDDEWEYTVEPASSSSLPFQPKDYAQLRDLLSACKQWRNGTLNRLKLVSPRNEPQPLAVDQALLDAIEKAEGKT